MRRGRLAKRPIGVVAKELLRYLQSQGMRDFYLPVDEETQLRALGALSTLRRVNDRIPIGAGKHIDGQTIILFVENLVGRAGAGQRPVGRFVQPGAKASMVNIVQQPQFRALMGELVAHLPKIERDASKALIHSDVIQGSEMLEWYGPYRADIRLRALVGRILDAAEGASPAATLRRLNKEIVEVVADVRRQPPVSSLGARVKSMGITDALSVLEAVVTPDARELEGWSRPGQSEHLSKVRDEASFVSAIHRDQGALLPLESLPRHLQAAVTSMATYEESGQQVFVVGPRLQEMFSETSLREIPSGALKTPYDSFYVALPDCDFSIWGDEATGWHRLSGFYVVDLVPSFAVMGLDAVGDEHGEKDAWLFFLWGAENSYSRGYGDDASFFFTVDKAALDKSGLDLEEWLRKKLSSKSLTHRDQTWDQITRWPGQGESPGRSASEEQKNEGQLGASIFTIRVFFNLLMYLRAADPEVVGDPDADANAKERKRLEKRIKETKNVKKRRQAKRTLTRISSAKIHYVGPSIEEAGEEEASELAKTGRRRHWVRGHWRQFRRGKWTWIQPHQRGRAGVLPRTYSLVDE